MAGMTGSLTGLDTLSGQLASQANGLSGRLAGENGLSGSLAPGGKRYMGATTFTPTQQTQVVYTQGAYMTTNITVEPIPTNYGLISWNGYTLTVS